jgi:cobalt-zinc-cadmium efflux system membrane fusion protein
VEVIPGTTDLGFTEIKFVENVDPNAKIVTKGAFYLLSAMKDGGEHDH